VKLDGGQVDLDLGHIVTAEGTRPLARMEAALLAYLFDNPGRVIPQSELLSEVWGYREGVVSRTVYTTVDRLRPTIEADPKKPRHLLSIRGVGYRFVPPIAPEDGLYGRTDELERLRAGGPVALVGAGGSGKTRLARELFAEQGGAWVEVTPQLSRDRLVERVGEELGRIGDPDPRDDLVVLDDVDLATPAALERVRSWVEAGHRIVTTSRTPLAFGPELRLEPLPPESASELLRARAEIDEGGVPLGELVERLEGSPLALTLAAGLLQTLPTALLVELLDTHGPLKLLVSVGDESRHGSLAAMLHASVDRLSEPAREGLGRLAGLGAPLGLDLARELAGELDEVLEAPLAEVDDFGRVWLLLGVRELAAGNPRPAWELLARAAKRERPLADSLAFAIAERAALEALVDDCDEGELVGPAALALARLADSRGPYRRLVEVTERALSTDPPGALELQLLRISGLRHLNRLDEAEAACRALTADPPLDPAKAATIELAWATVEMSRGRMPEAVERLEAIQEFSGRVGTRRLGAALHYVGRNEEALGWLERAIVLDREAGDPIAVCLARNTVAMALSDLGRLPEAMEQWAEAADEARAAGAEVRAAMCESNQGATLGILGDHEAARTLLTAALAVFEEHDERRLHKFHRYNLAFAELQAGNTELAESIYQEVLEANEAVGDDRGRALALAGLAQVRPETREVLLREALALFEAQSNRRMVLLTRAQLARISGNTADLAQALAQDGERPIPEVAVALAVLGRLQEAHALADRLGVVKDGWAGRMIYE